MDNVWQASNPTGSGDSLSLDNTTPFVPDADYEPATKKYVDDNAVAGADEGSKSKIFDLVFDSLASFNIDDTVPSSGRIYKIIINVTTAFDGVTESTLTIGDSGNAARLCDNIDLNLNIIGVYNINNYYTYISETQLTGSYVQDGATVGAASIEVLYIIN